MKKDLPHVFANKISNNINNNEKVFYSSKNRNTENKDAPSLIGQSVNQKLNTIFSSSNYISKAIVKIYFENEILFYMFICFIYIYTIFKYSFKTKK